MRNCKGGWRTENRLQTWTDGESTVHIEYRVDVTASIQNFFCQIVAQRRGPRETGCTGGKMYRRMVRMTSHDRREVL